MKLTIILFVSFFMSGCVSIGYHQRTLREARTHEVQNAAMLIEKISNEEISSRDASKFVLERLLQLEYVEKICQ